jgi:Type III restriction enzyme, res subunit
MTQGVAHGKPPQFAILNQPQSIRESLESISGLVLDISGKEGVEQVRPDKIVTIVPIDLPINGPITHLCVLNQDRHPEAPASYRPHRHHRGRPAHGGVSGRSPSPHRRQQSRGRRALWARLGSTQRHAVGGGGMATRANALQDRVKLWRHQAEAFKIVQRYLRRTRTRGKPPGAALVNIPTGGGKTAIIALLAHEGEGVRRALVLAPRLGIRNQLQAELDGTRLHGFFEKQGLKKQDLGRAVVTFSSAADIDAAVKHDAILVSTIQLVDRFRQEAPDKFAKFAVSIDVVLVDEGHYEPARSWSVTIRSFSKPAVLFTATPYRNDLRAFAIDVSAIHITRFADVQRDRFIRKVKVVAAKSDNSPNLFADSVLQAFRKEFGGPPNASCKLIVRCDRKDGVAKMGAAFAKKGLTVVGLHERFTRHDMHVDNWKRRSPGDPEEAGAPAVWIHQHKLLEGVDGPSFRAVAMYGPLGSVRALVQQVGRIIRNPGRKANQTALVLDHRGGLVERNWKRFERYDAVLNLKDLTRGAPEIVREAFQNLPPLDYIAENFRERFDLQAPIDVVSDIAVPTSAYFLQTSSSFKLDAFLRAVQHDLEERALDHRHFKLAANKHVILYIAWRNSPLLREHYFIELTLHAILVRDFGQHFAYLDTGGGAPFRADEIAVQGPVSRDHLSRLISHKSGSRITGVTTRNAALGPRAVRIRYTSAASIGDTVPFLDDFQHVPTSMIGISPERWRANEIADGEEVEGRRPRLAIRRYVGLGRGHITEAGSRLSLEQYFEWVEQAEKRLSSRRKSVELFGRYARVFPGVPHDPDPRNILLDLEEARLVYETLDREGLTAHQQLELEDACADCKKERPGIPRRI